MGVSKENPDSYCCWANCDCAYRLAVNTAKQNLLAVKAHLKSTQQAVKLGGIAPSYSVERVLDLVNEVDEILRGKTASLDNNKIVESHKSKSDNI